MCTRPIQINVFNSRLEGHDYGRYFMVDKNVVPCGKCPECLKARQNSFAVRLYKEAEKFSQMSFVTLTYDNEHVPISQSIWTVDKSSGEMLQVGKPSFLDDEPIAVKVRDFLSSARSSPLGTVFRHTIADIDECEYCVQYAFSLRRRDVRLWLKAARVAYEREYGHKLPEFRTFCCGEYGPRTSRPHYHLIFLGLSPNDTGYLLSRWKYGFTDLKTVRRFNQDNSNGWFAACKYISKYCSKGQFETPLVPEGLVEKPRVFASKGLGLVRDGKSYVVPERVRSYHMAFDVFGEYDPQTLVLKSSGLPLSNEQLDVLVDRIIDRRYISLPLKSSSTSAQMAKYKMPVTYLHKIFGYYEQSSTAVFDEKAYAFKIQDSRVFRYYTIYCKVKDTLQSRAYELYLDELRQIEGIGDGQIDASAIRKFYNIKAASLAVREKTVFEDLRSTYARSIY